ncbi:FkbM family methyltransferase [Agrobacterium tumefaciens]|uniref:FkbM family methyltransferase n=1 Tax=Agrobacterium tumefaciens TaxID=358 RepID=UPI0015722D77|nr:FkbM family methyltransferase [Agrobacterium tumefaciens]NTB05216.1 FkbM family methyltransferase [Agrobacterium tumefaciens]
MTLSAFRHSSSFLLECKKRGLLENLNLSLLDVGCSGGIDSFWDQFGESFRAVGFDPLVSEVDRLNAEVGTKRDIRYVAAWVGNGARPLPLSVRIDTETKRGASSAFVLSSAHRASEKTGLSFTADVFNRGAELRFADQRLSLDEWLAANEFGRVDVVKCDVDGFDFEVFVGAQDLLSGPKRPLALITEAQLHEMRDRHGTVWGDLDRLLRDHGYRLFDVDVHRYTRGALPGRFAIPLFAQTVDGPVMFCDALYMLDPVMDPEVMDELVEQGDTTVFLKLIFLYETFGLPDCAAALIVALRERDISVAGLDDSWALDALVPPNPYSENNYNGYLGAFDANPRQLFPQKSLSVVEEFVPGTTVDWISMMLPGEGSRREGLDIVSERGVGGHLCFGPYHYLPTGRYVARLQIETDVSLGQKLSLEVVADEKVVSSYSKSLWISGSHWLEIPFDIEAANGDSSVQLRLTVGRKAKQRLLRVIIRRES